MLLSLYTCNKHTHLHCKPNTSPLAGADTKKSTLLTYLLHFSRKERQHLKGKMKVNDGIQRDKYITVSTNVIQKKMKREGWQCQNYRNKWQSVNNTGHTYTKTNPIPSVSVHVFRFAVHFISIVGNEDVKRLWVCIHDWICENLPRTAHKLSIRDMSAEAWIVSLETVLFVTPVDFLFLSHTTKVWKLSVLLEEATRWKHSLFRYTTYYTCILWCALLVKLKTCSTSYMYMYPTFPLVSTQTNCLISFGLWMTIGTVLLIISGMSIWILTFCNSGRSEREQNNYVYMYLYSWLLSILVIIHRQLMLSVSDTMVSE